MKEITNMENCLASTRLIEEIKIRIKERFKNQEKFGKELGISRKSLNRLLNHSDDIYLLFEICKLLDIEKIKID